MDRKWLRAPQLISRGLSGTRNLNSFHLVGAEGWMWGVHPGLVGSPIVLQALTLGNCLTRKLGAKSANGRVQVHSHPQLTLPLLQPGIDKWDWGLSGRKLGCFILPTKETTKWRNVMESVICQGMNSNLSEMQFYCVFVRIKYQHDIYPSK